MSGFMKIVFKISCPAQSNFSKVDDVKNLKEMSVSFLSFKIIVIVIC